MSAVIKSIFSPLPTATRGQNFHLNTDPKNQKLLYCNGPAVIVRDLANPSECYTYSEHAATPTAACFAPSGYYIASGDSAGKVRIWDTTQETHLLKFEAHGLGGSIKDICWSPDSKRILLAGAGREKRANCFMWDSGTSCGTVFGGTKNANAVAHSPSRPFRAVVVSEDYSVTFHTGVPYKFEKTISEHKNFVNSVRFHPAGLNFCTVSSDKRALLFDGKTGESVGEFKDAGEFAHNGGVMAVSYNATGSQLITASADKTVKLWDTETQKCVTTFQFDAKNVEDQQLGCLWAGDFLVSLSLAGVLTYLDPATGSPSRVLRGHAKSIEAMEVRNKKIYTASFDGRKTVWDAETGDAEWISGGHQKIMDMRVTGDNTLTSVDIEQKVTKTALDSLASESSNVSLPSQANYMATGNGIEVYACENALALVRNGSTSTTPTKYNPSGCAISPSGSVLAVAAADEPTLYLYDIDGDSIVQRQTVTLSASCEEIFYSPDGAFLAGAGRGRSPLLLDVTKDYKPVIHCWSSSAALKTCSFSPDSRLVAYAGIDTNILVGNIQQPMDSPIKIIRAHPLGTINRVRWCDENTIVSTGSDCQVRQFTVTC